MRNGNENMAVRSIMRMGEPVLYQVARPIELFDTPELHLLLTDMRDTMEALNGAGIAAPQIGESVQVVIFEVRNNPRYPDAESIPATVLINPVVMPLSDAIEEGWEGCLSVPGMRGLVPRYQRIGYSGFDEHGNRFEREVEGFHARVVQHECDHLMGILYPMRIRDFSKFGFIQALFPGEDIIDE